MKKKIEKFFAMVRKKIAKKTEKRKILKNLLIAVLYIFILKEIVEEIELSQNHSEIEKKNCQYKYEANLCEENFYLPELEIFCYEMFLCKVR